MNDKTSQLSPEAIAARRAYQAGYRRRNPDRVRTWSKTYWEKKAAKNAAEGINVQDENGQAPSAGKGGVPK